MSDQNQTPTASTVEPVLAPEEIAAVNTFLQQVDVEALNTVIRDANAIADGIRAASHIGVPLLVIAQPLINAAKPILMQQALKLMGQFGVTIDDAPKAEVTEDDVAAFRELLAKHNLDEARLLAFMHTVTGAKNLTDVCAYFHADAAEDGLTLDEYCAQTVEESNAMGLGLVKQ